LRLTNPALANILLAIFLDSIDIIYIISGAI